jgi:tetratricopeptide (TPR) repeat protein
MSLSAVEEDCRVYSMQMEELKMEQSLGSCLLMWRTVLELMGRSQEAAELEDSHNVFNEAENDNKLVAATLEMHRTFLLGYSGRNEAGADVALAKGDRLASQIPAKPLIMTETFLRGLSLFAMARKRKKRKYKKEASRILAKIKNWVEQGNPNVRHYETLLEAESAALKGKKYAAMKHYEYAVKISARGGFVQDAAIASERFGEFMLDEMNDKEEAIYRFNEAIRYYREWGAVTRAGSLREQYAELWPRPREIIAIIE